MNFIIAGSATNSRIEPRTGTQDVELVVAVRSVNLQAFYIYKIDKSSGSRHEVVGYHEDIGDRRTIDDHRVDARSAVDIDIRVLQIVVKLLLRPGSVDIRSQIVSVGPQSTDNRPCLRTSFIRQILLRDQVGVDNEQIIARFTIQPDLGPVVVDFELIITGAAKDLRRRSHSRRRSTEINNRHTSTIECCDNRTDRNCILAAAEADFRIGPIVVKTDRVVAFPTIHNQLFNLRVVMHDIRVCCPNDDSRIFIRLEGIEHFQSDKVCDSSTINLQQVQARRAACVSNVNVGTRTIRGEDDITLRRSAGVIGPVIKRNFLVPWSDRQCRHSTDRDTTIIIVHDKPIVSITTREDCMLEDGPSALLRQSFNLSFGVPGIEITSRQYASQIKVPEQTQIQIPGFAERVDTTGIKEGINTRATSDGVVTNSGINLVSK